jgi:iron complex outermembrane receptor protein
MKTFTSKKKPIAVLISLIISGVNLSVAAQEAEATQTDIDSSALEVIEVTAQKRVQNLQQVPVAVTAISGDAISKGVIKDVFDLQASVPGMTVNQSTSPAAAIFSIRGVGTSSQNFGLESSVGLYMDGVYRAKQGALTNNYYDIESVQVLRGPQGTLFGKNTPSGAVLVQSVAPDHDGTGYVEMNVGNLGLVNWGFAKSFSAIDDELAFRISHFSSKRDGYISDVNLGKDKINNKDRSGTRLQALYTPNDDITLRIIADYAELDEVCCAAGTVINNYQASGIDGKFGSDAFISQLPSVTITNAEQYDDYVVALSMLPAIEIEDKGVSAQLDWALSDSTTLVSITGLRDFSYLETFDNDYTNANFSSADSDLEQKSFSQELRFDYVSDDLNATVGLFYFEQSIDGMRSSNTNSDLNPYVMNGILGGQFNGLINGINTLSVATNGLIAPAQESIPTAMFANYSEQEHDSWAVFGQFDYQLTEQLIVTAGLRYTEENKELENVFEEIYASGATHSTAITHIGNPAFPQTITPSSLLYNAASAGQALQGIVTGAIPPGSPQFAQAIQTFSPFQQEGWIAQSLTSVFASRPDLSTSMSDKKVSGTVKLTYQPNSDLMAYASYGTGYKSGGTNTDRIAVGFDPIFDSENSGSAEVGLKVDFPESNLRVNVAAHHTKTEDFQSNVFIGDSFSLQNAGDYLVKGVEVESLWIPLAGTRISLSYSYTDATFDSFERGPCWTITPWQTGQTDPGQQILENGAPAPYCDRSGDRPFSQPKSKGTLGIEQGFMLSENVYSYAMIEYSYMGDLFTDSSNDPISIRDAQGVFNARLFFSFDKYDFDVVLWGRNIGKDDENWSPQSIPAPLQTGKMLNFYTEPATFGVSFKKRF